MSQEMTMPLCPINAARLPRRVSWVFGMASSLTIALLMTPTPAIAQERGNALEQEIKTIKSVAQVKGRLKDLIESRDTCAVGSCFNFTSTAICDQIGMLDVQVNGQIVQSMTSVGSPGAIPISKPDLDLMRQMFSQCKPTNYQYWNWDQILHVYYVPNCTVDQQVRKALGVKASKQRARCSP
ncbi:MAG: hypothetical protein VKJ24_20360 [Synechococcales bacterium]|nr:hypothetical protein [Synechococcales bacterium]